MCIYEAGSVRFDTPTHTGPMLQPVFTHMNVSKFTYSEGLSSFTVKQKSTRNSALEAAWEVALRKLGDKVATTLILVKMKLNDPGPQSGPSC